MIDMLQTGILSNSENAVTFIGHGAADKKVLQVLTLLHGKVQQVVLSSGIGGDDETAAFSFAAEGIEAVFDKRGRNSKSSSLWIFLGRRTVCENTDESQNLRFPGQNIFGLKDPFRPACRFHLRNRYTGCPEKGKDHHGQE
jgi:hypothetical protein